MKSSVGPDCFLHEFAQAQKTDGGQVNPATHFSCNVHAAPTPQTSVALSFSVLESLDWKDVRRPT